MAESGSTKEADPWLEIDPLKRLQLALDTGFMTNVTFQVGSEKFRCHSQILGIASPKFAEMMANNELRLPDMDPRHFKLILEIIYSGRTSIVFDVEQLLKVGQSTLELQVLAAAVYCVTKLNEMMDDKTACQVLDFATVVNNEQLKEACLKIIRTKARAVVNSESILQCTHATLEAIVQQNELNQVTELELFRTCIRWAWKHNESSSPRETLGPVLQFIRFRAMSVDEFSEYVCSSGILTAEEEKDILRCIATGKDQMMPKGFSKYGRRMSQLGHETVGKNDQVPKTPVSPQTRFNVGNNQVPPVSPQTRFNVGNNQVPPQTTFNAGNNQVPTVIGFPQNMHDFGNVQVPMASVSHATMFNSVLGNMSMSKDSPQMNKQGHQEPVKKGQIPKTVASSLSFFNSILDSMSVPISRTQSVPLGTALPLANALPNLLSQACSLSAAENTTSGNDKFYLGKSEEILLYCEGIHFNSLNSRRNPGHVIPLKFSVNMDSYLLGVSISAIWLNWYRSDWNRPQRGTRTGTIALFDQNGTIISSVIFSHKMEYERSITVRFPNPCELFALNAYTLNIKFSGDWTAHTLDYLDMNKRETLKPYIQPSNLEIQILESVSIPLRSFFIAEKLLQ